jgi:polar amino acid transport system substrate-binding protein
MRRRLLLQAGAGFGMGPTGGAQPNSSGLNLLAGDVPPYSAPGEGWLDRRVQLLARQAQHEGAIQRLPWARALLQARAQGQSLIYPLARVPEREAQWHWLSLLAMDELLLLVRRDALSEAQLRDPVALRLLRVGTLRVSLHATRLRLEGFERVEYAPHEPSNARKLALGRIQAWAVTRAVSDHLLSRERIDRRTLHGPVRRGMVALYLAATTDVGMDQLAPWMRALNAASRFDRG